MLEREGPAVCLIRVVLTNLSTATFPIGSFSLQQSQALLNLCKTWHPLALPHYVKEFFLVVPPWLLSNSPPPPPRDWLILLKPLLTLKQVLSSLWWAMSQSCMPLWRALCRTTIAKMPQSRQEFVLISKFNSTNWKQQIVPFGKAVSPSFIEVRPLANLCH